MKFIYWYDIYMQIVCEAETGKYIKVSSLYNYWVAFEPQSLQQSVVFHYLSNEEVM